MSNKKVILGIDGVPFHLIDDLSDQGDMPNFQSIKKDGHFSKMHSAIPEVSNVNWSSIVTGKNPGEHGIYGFTELIHGTYTVSFPDRRALKAEPFWKDDKRYVIINVPAMYPADNINGTMVSGFVSPELERAVTPDSALKFLKSIDYQVDVDAEKAHKSYRLFLDNLFNTLEKREKALTHFWDERWDAFMFVFTGSDRLEHFLWNAYEDPSHEYHERFIDYFKEVDRILGKVLDRMNDDDELIMLSDHGMESIEQNVNVNKVLEDNGFLKLGDSPEKRYKNIESGTKAFALDPGRIYLNKKDRYPRGIDIENITDDLIDIFNEVKYDGKKVINHVHRRDDVYHGRYVGKAPDLVLTPEKGFNLKGSVKYDKLFDKNIFQGKHTADDAFIYSSDVPIPKDPNVEDFIEILKE
ncbi:MAG: alkaline phosphatase family protein [Thermoplasmatota archaeon]